MAINLAALQAEVERVKIVQQAAIAVIQKLKSDLEAANKVTVDPDTIDTVVNDLQQSTDSLNNATR